VAAVQDIKRRIRSVRNTRKITRAMELVSAAKLRRAQTRIEAMRPYAERMQELVVGVARASSSVRGLPLLQRRDVQRAAILPLTGDRGLAGAFNGQILREAFALQRRLREEGVEPRWLVAGKKGASTLPFRRYEIEQAWAGFSDHPRYHDAQAIAHRISQLYAEQEVDRVVVIYNHFESALTQRVVAQEILPIP
jgi:F-type H+-transporting ATPase subunit gamma